MNLTIQQAREVDKRLSAIAPDLPEKVAQAMQGTRLAKTASVLARFVLNLESLKNGLLDASEAGNLYAASVLFRVFLEHLLKTLAIYLKATHELSDAYAEQYLQLIVKEAKDYLTAYRRAKLDEARLHELVLYPYFKEAEALSNSEAKKTSEPFTHRQLIDTILGFVDVAGPNFLHRIIPNYSELSGFVHGGPSAMVVLDAIEDAEATAEVLARNADLTVHMFTSARRWLVTIAETVHPSFSSLFDELSKALGDEVEPENK